MFPPGQNRSLSYVSAVITALEWSGNARGCNPFLLLLTPHFVVDSLVAAVVEVVVDVDHVGEGIVALRGVLDALVQAVSNHLGRDEHDM